MLPAWPSACKTDSPYSIAMPVRRAAQNGDTNKSPVVKTDPDDMEVEGKRGAKASAAMPPSSRAENGKSASPPKAAGSKSAVKTNAASTGTKTSPPAKASKGATKAGAPGSDYGARAIVVAMVGGFLLAACIYLYGQGGMSALSGIAKYSLSSGRKDVGKSKTMIERSKKLKALLKDEFPDDSQKEAVKIVRQVALAPACSPPLHVRFAMRCLAFARSRGARGLGSPAQ